MSALRCIQCTFVLAFALPATGCVTHALETSTIAATRTLMKVENQEVLDNIAQFAANPGALPHFAVVSGGAFQMNDTLGATPTLGWSPFGLTSVMLGLNGQRNTANQWSLQPIYDPDKLKKMRCLYRYVVNPSNPAFCLSCNEYFAAIMTPPKVPATLTTATAAASDTCGIPTGFFRCGRECDVSPCACYVSHCADLWVGGAPRSGGALTADPVGPRCGNGNSTSNENDKEERVGPYR